MSANERTVTVTTHYTMPMTALAIQVPAHYSLDKIREIIHAEIGRFLPEGCLAQPIIIGSGGHCSLRVIITHPDRQRHCKGDRIFHWGPRMGRQDCSSCGSSHSRSTQYKYLPPFFTEASRGIFQPAEFSRNAKGRTAGQASSRNGVVSVSALDLRGYLPL